MKFDMIVFTGSTQKGKMVAEAAGRNLVPCVLELGGKSPAIIDESANAVGAAKKVIFGKMPNLGQVCIAPDYILCHESKLD
jgi:acyl-CoA reductase-like NAD-dependent aldehyde dehydrogenase